MRTHMSANFMVWNRRQSWFWMVLNQHGNGGTIGTAATEADAVHEAHSTIEEMFAQPPSLPLAPGLSERNAVMLLNRAYPCSAAALGWMDWWVNVAHQVTDRMLTRWADLVVRSS